MGMVDQVVAVRETQPQALALLDKVTQVAQDHPLPAEAGAGPALRAAARQTVSLEEPAVMERLLIFLKLWLLGMCAAVAVVA